MPSHKKAIELAWLSWSNVLIQAPLLVSQILIVPYDADATCVLLCEKATEMTSLLWPSNVLIQAPLLVSQILIVPYDADATCVLLCEKATEMTSLLWPSNVLIQAPLLVSQILTVLSPDADAICVLL